ncbi:insulinase family protein [Fulvivirgaceae bacterium PWU4]|uniref:Insulinase family protein n=1 Tax=Chryseosolibacter histidini TaxID=2782349 RepID=A0AAP2DHQ9_9BACT|nr:pitrilysin family protein [Chryseosolibacter histidini]MBT1696345.1 insulinase family protein [Chryseosolibacter histidini]
MRNIKVFKLSNGIKVVHQHLATTKIVHCGIIVDVGSRDENTENQGIAHFWEHMAFKGTRRRRSFNIINSLDSVGGELNAYTDKEKVVFYASVRDEYFEKAVDILSDITFHSVFPENQIEKERGVILEEMAMYHDSPDESLQDEFEAIVYKDHPMGMNILGKPETVKSFRKRDFLSFFKNTLSTDKIVFSCVGNISVDQVERLARKYFEGIVTRKALVRRKGFRKYKANEQILKRTIKQAKCAIGRDAYPMRHENRIPLFILANMLGGPGMNSRLNLALREKYGFVYSIDAHYIPYTDTGMFAVFFGTEPKQLDRCISLVKKELNRFCEKPLTRRQLDSAKEQIKGQLAMAEENNLSLMLMMGRSVLDLGRVPTLEEIYYQIDETDSLKLRDIAQEIFDEKTFSYLIMEPDKMNGHGSNGKEV